MTITLNGTTGITTPDITSSGSLNIDASAPDNSLVVNSAGNVGIGTTSVSGKLSINGEVYAAAGAVSGVAYGFYPKGTYGNTGMFSPAANTVAFATTGGERVRIDSSGNVGIGTSAPVQKLELNENTTSGGPYLQFENRGTGTTDNTNTYNVGGMIAAGYRDSSNPSNIASITFQRAPSASGASSAGSIVFGAMANGTTGIPTERARIDSSGNLKFNSGYGSAATAYGCRAWVNFNGIGTVSIRASGNVSSITDNGTGDYTVNFSIGMPDANYSIVLTAGYTTNGGNPSFGVANRIGSTGNEEAPTISSFRLNVDNTTGNVNDSKYVYAAVFR